ncbi:homeobox protein 5 [Stomoxys calcitrans]|uniref:homeobox protein 5 n=1 Tax=Stomoxys calcitrans TaxID=35570 RepID=UPI0027E31256|nr:homeobox protein 5 [Stomoxys calcitrans]
MDSLDLTSPMNASPPDFDFNLPCRFFKSSFARSLSLNSSSGGGGNNQCKSLDYDIHSSDNSNNNNNCLPKPNNNSGGNASTTTSNGGVGRGVVNGGFLKRDGPPPVPLKPNGVAASSAQDGTVSFSSSAHQQSCKNGANNEPVDSPQKDDADDDDGTTKTNAGGSGGGGSVKVATDKPPALPARRPTFNGHSNAGLQQQQQNMQASLTHLRQQAFNQALSQTNANAAILPVNVTGASDASRGSTPQQPQQFNQKVINHYQPVAASRGPTTISGSSNSSGCGSNNDSISSNGSSSANQNNNSNNVHQNFRRNIVWPNQTKQNVEQDCNFYDADNDDDIHFIEYHDTTKLANPNDFSATPTTANQQHQHHMQRQQQQPQLASSHQMMIPTIMTTNISNNPQHQQQQQHPYEVVVHDNTTNVEAVILQNQVDTLHWQLKQVETSCDMYRAVMEEVARFLERYQKQRQLQQQQLQQQQQQMAAQKHINNEQISRSKSLYQVNASGGGQDKCTSLGHNLVDDSPAASSASSSSYLRVRSSTNLIDLKQTEGNKLTNGKGRHSKDDHNFETGLAPSQSYSAFKDFTWRRLPKKANDLRGHKGGDDADEKLNQEAFRLFRTIQNLLNTSQHQADIAHHSLTHQRHSLAPSAILGHLGRISKAISTSSVATLPGVPMHNSTTLTANCGASTTSDSSTASPTIAASPNTLAPADMLFLRSANMRDSRLSLRSSTDSSVHSTSSVASSASSKVETDEEPNTPFQGNILTQHKPSHHHIAGSSTEDESGFSSISSFPDVGVPFSSTMLSSHNNGNKGRKTTEANDMRSQKAHGDKDLLSSESRNSTLKANVVGLPLNSSQDMTHRWDSPSKTYHNASTKFQRFSALANSEDANTVLWV